MVAVVEYKESCHDPLYLRIMSTWARQNVRNLLVYYDWKKYVQAQYQIAVVDCYGELVAVPHPQAH